MTKASNVFQNLIVSQNVNYSLGIIAGHDEISTDIKSLRNQDGRLVR